MGLSDHIFTQKYIFCFSALLRLAFVGFGEWQDAHLEVRYTDVDYSVFSDAAALMVKGRSPFDRETYRYSPLLALLLVPNILLHRCWGKFLFSAADLLAGYLIHRILSLRGVQERKCVACTALWLFNPFTFTVATRGNCEALVCSIILWILYCLMNGEFTSILLPIFDICFSLLSHLRIRGRISMTVILAPLIFLWDGYRSPGCASRLLFNCCELAGFTPGRLLEAAVSYGVVVHFRIYPIIYAAAIVIVLDNEYLKAVMDRPRIMNNFVRPGDQASDFDHGNKVTAGVLNLPKDLSTPTISFQFLMRKFVNRHRIIFGLVSGGVFFFLTGVSYFFYGQKFLHEALFYHLTRTDPRHNFSIYFYHIYLHHAYSFTLMERLLSFVPQFLVQLVLTMYFAKDLQFCIFSQTVAFVAFNKVITAQYFVWFFCLLPLILPWTKMSLRWKGILCMAFWTGAQLHWLAWAYFLEFQGRNVFLQLWLSSNAFFIANVVVLSIIICHHTVCPFRGPFWISGKDDPLVNRTKLD